MHDPGDDGCSGPGPAWVELPLTVVSSSRLPVASVGSGWTHVHGDSVVQREVQLTYGHNMLDYSYRLA